MDLHDPRHADAGAADAPARLVAVAYGVQPGGHALVGRITELGRHPSQAVRFLDPVVSRRHARIVRAEERYLLLDGGSTNGTYVNGRRVSEAPLPLADGDRIGLGRHAPHLRFVAPGRSPNGA